MLHSTLTLFPFAGLVAATALPPRSAGTPVSITPHEQFSSSIGVLGCKIDTNRVAYWPGWPDCNNLCVKVTHTSGRFVHLLRIDASAGAHDISYDAWNYLYNGQSARVQPAMDGGIPATWEDVPMTDPACSALLDKAGGRLPLAAATSMNFFFGCAPGTWARDNTALFNILNPQCTWGLDEECGPPVDGGNQPECPGGFNTTNPLTSAPVMNIKYGTSVEEVAL